MSAFRSKDAQVKLSKKMSSALRHRAHDMKLNISTDGYVAVRELLHNYQFRGYTCHQLEECVRICPKQRFQLKTDIDGEKYVRATQGHSISTVKDDELMELIPDAAALPVCLHGTYAKYVDSIMKTGLSRMKRNNIHLIACMPSEIDGVMSGMRNSADTIITLDVESAMAAGIKFYRSSNGVILSPGLGDTGCIPPQFISEVLHRGQKMNRPRSEGSRRKVNSNTNKETIGEKHTKEEECVQEVCKEESSYFFQFDSTSSRPFSHYCVIDFEATCLDKKDIYPQEIIEFPAVFINASTLEVVSEFHSYVRPLHHPILSDFCTSLTGITQEIVNSAPDFSTVYMNFCDFMSQFRTQYRRENNDEEINILFSSCGDWDFQTMLIKQCTLSGLVVPPPMTQWMNVKALFAQAETSREKRHEKGEKRKKARLGMVGMMSELGLELVGRHHSGIDDTRNIARIVVELVRNRGAMPSITSTSRRERISVRKSAAKSMKRNKYSFT